MEKRIRRTLLFIFLLALVPQLAVASGASEQFTNTTILLIIVITLADWCGYIFERAGLPELVGEIAAGIVLGNLALLGLPYDVGEMLRTNDFLYYAAELGVILLLFLVGIESDLKSMLKVGINSTLVAAVGGVLPIALGLLASISLGTGGGLLGWFIGATLAATSVGITAKILDEKGKLTSKSSGVILGAAVIDDIMGIIILAVLAGIAVGDEFSYAGLGLILFKAIAFLVIAVLVGQLLFPPMIRFTGMSQRTGFWAGFSLCLALIGAQMAAFAGLAPLIGAFVAGLLLEDKHFKGQAMKKQTIEQTMKPAADVLLAVFFVSIGTQVRLDTLLDPQILLLVGVLFVVAIVSKGAAGFAIVGKGFDRAGIGLGMIPRGEVGLVFATFAYHHEVFDSSVYSAMVMVVLLTTIAGPILLKPRLKHF